MIGTIGYTLQINGSLARRAIRDLMAKGLLRLVSAHMQANRFTTELQTPKFFTVHSYAVLIFDEDDSGEVIFSIPGDVPYSRLH